MYNCSIGDDVAVYLLLPGLEVNILKLFCCFENQHTHNIVQAGKWTQQAYTVVIAPKYLWSCIVPSSLYIKIIKCTRRFYLTLKRELRVCRVQFRILWTVLTAGNDVGKARMNVKRRENWRVFTQKLAKNVPQMSPIFDINERHFPKG